MLGSDEVFRQGRVLLRDGRVSLQEMLSGHTSLGNFIDANNEAYIRWLKRLGCKFERLHENSGVQKREFWEFSVSVEDLKRNLSNAGGWDVAEDRRVSNFNRQG
jgi:hypothetical protein